MIIGNNNFSPNNNNFKNNMNSIRNNNSISNNMHTKQYKDINNSNEMIDESIEMLQDRFNKGLIKYDDFIKQCEKLNKLRK